MRIRGAASMPVSVLFTSEFEIPPAIEAEWLSHLPVERQARISAWPERRDRLRSLLGSRLLATGLARLGFAATAPNTLRTPPGTRPTLDLPVQFSVSHCAGRVVCAISTEGAVGVDVEALGGLTADEFPLYLNPAERAWAGRNARRFYGIWTRKEAVAKAAGTRGLPALPRVDTTCGPQRAALDGRIWRTTPIALGRRHVGHLALPDARATVSVEPVSREALCGRAGDNPGR